MVWEFIHAGWNSVVQCDTMDGSSKVVFDFWQPNFVLKIFHSKILIILKSVLLFKKWIPVLLVVL